MALQKDYETKEGFIANYWRITAMHLTAKNTADTILVCLYKDKASRDANKEPVFSKVWTFPFVENPETENEIIHTTPFTLQNLTEENCYDLAYNWLKTLGEFSGCVDC